MIILIEQKLLIHVSMGEVKEINIKNLMHYFLGDIIDKGNFYSSLLKIDEKSYKDIDIY